MFIRGDWPLLDEIMSNNDDEGFESRDPLRGEDVDEEKLKGDAIGDTLYSEKWLIQTLMKLTQELPKYSTEQGETEPVELDDELESDLCLLWDMTADRDVAACLCKHDVMALIKCFVSSSRAPRLTEICIGILANMSCDNQVAAKITEDEEMINLIIATLFSDDIPTILQCLRLLDVLVQIPDENFIKLIRSSEQIWTNISFILSNSLNEELLCSSAKLLDLLISHLKLDDSQPQLPDQELLAGILECLAQLRKEVQDEVPESIGTATNALVSSLYNLTRLEQMRSKLVENREPVCEQLLKILGDLSNSLVDGDKEENLTLLMTCSVEAVTVYYVVNDPSHCRQLLERAAELSRAMARCSSVHQSAQFVADFDDLVCDCLCRIGRQVDAESLLRILDPLDATSSSYVGNIVQRAVSDLRDEWISSARSLNLCQFLFHAHQSESGLNE